MRQSLCHAATRHPVRPTPNQATPKEADTDGDMPSLAMRGAALVAVCSGRSVQWSQCAVVTVCYRLRFSSNSLAEVGGRGNGLPRQRRLILPNLWLSCVPGTRGLREI